jgi:hypothetical protein
MKAKRAAIAARFTVFIEATALCALILPQAFRRDDGIVRARICARDDALC